MMRTPWGEALEQDSKAIPWPEYPRPAMQRDQWVNLNGWWSYAVTDKQADQAPESWDGEIRVPFAIESPLSGIERRFGPEDVIWYRRNLEVQKRGDRRYRLNFEAVDYHSTLWVNDQKIGEHIGGNLPFSFDVTDALQGGSNVITLRVTDATDTAYQLHGKQRLNPRGIWYTPVSGIWQTVWMEEVPAWHITGIKVTSQIDGNALIELSSEGPSPSGAVAQLTAKLDGRTVALAEGPPHHLRVVIPEPQLWSPASPTLYDLTIQLGEDVVQSSLGLREIGRHRDADGHWRFTLNGEDIFPWGTLDQGWWPDGLLTPPSDEAMRSDIEFLKAAGFNTIRKHIKVEPRRYYWHCDRIGMLVWQDQVSAMSDNPEWTRLQPDPETKVWPAEAHRQFMSELRGMIDLLQPHPSIVQWVPFNERWGQHQTMDVGEWTVAYDPTRHVNIASGGNFFPVGHVVDHHQYPHPDFPFELGEGGRFDDFVKVVGEFGGHGFPVQGHLWDPNARNWGYGGLPENQEEWEERYRESIRLLAELRGRGIAAGIYTQTTDVEGEINGLITYDRRVPKVSAAWLREVHEAVGLVEPGPIGAAEISAKNPNIITVFIDDMGWTDLSCFGGDAVETTNIDRLASEGIRFNHFYVNSPICSPSRVALTTGQYPFRWRISSYLAHRRLNIERGMAQWLDPAAPVLARELRRGGYATGHFGKWHMGGQRDVGEAPLIQRYGFDRSLTNFEGLGPRVLGIKDAYDGKPPGKHTLGSDNLGRGEIRWVDRSVITAEFVRDAVHFIDQAERSGKPFYINLWPDDVHSPFFPPEDLRKGTDGGKRDLYYAVLQAMDHQLGSLFDRVTNDDSLRDNTLIVICSDNGHEQGAGRSDPLRGGKTWLYEGGIRSPLIVWGPGLVAAEAAGTVNEESIFSAIDLNVSLYPIAGIDPPQGASLDGENVSNTILGKSKDSRSAPIYFRRPPDRPGTTDDPNPDLAVRDGQWKYLVHLDGSREQLYDLDADISESHNVADRYPEIAERLRQAVFEWNSGMPIDAVDPDYIPGGVVDAPLESLQPDR